MKKRVIGYIRVSTNEQVEKGHSLDAQRAAIEQFCASRGWELVEIKVEAGISGTKDDRPALTELLEAVEQGRCDVVIVHAIDRFYRDLQALLKAFNHLRQHNVTFISIVENLDFTTPWGKLALAVLGTLAEIYIDRLRQETRKGKRARAVKGLHNGAPPLGYCYGACSSCNDPNGKGYCPRYGDSNRQDYTPSQPLLPHPIEREAVRLAFEWHATGQYSDGDVAERLNERAHTLSDGTEVGFRTKGRWGRGSPGRFSKDSVRDMLQNPYYVGKVPYYGCDAKGRKRKRGDYVALYPGRHEPIVDEKTFERSLEIRNLMSHHPRTRGDNALERIYVLSGILRCGYCGEPMRAHSSNGGVRYYRDKSQVQHLRDCPQRYVHADDVEAQFDQIVQSVQLSPHWRERVVAALNPDMDGDEIRGREETLSARLARAKQLYIEGDIDRAHYDRESARYKALLSDLRPARYDDIMTAGEILESASEDWNALTPLQKKKRSRTMFTTVLIRGTRLVAG
ncbi:MAG: recombinase family protein, partial [Chloroflexota bacterium]|nr:recombinase family protein [Chloroflexota bacterium]